MSSVFIDRSSAGRGQLYARSPESFDAIYSHGASRLREPHGMIPLGPREKPAACWPTIGEIWEGLEAFSLPRNICLLCILTEAQAIADICISGHQNRSMPFIAMVQAACAYCKEWSFGSAGKTWHIWPNYLENQAGPSSFRFCSE